MCRGPVCTGVDWGPLRVVAEVDVGGESVTQILGGEIVQRCRGHGSCERSDIVSLIIDSLQQLRQRRPVSLSDQPLVELVGQDRPPLLRWDLRRPGEPSLDLVDAAQGFGGCPPGVGVPVLHLGEQGLPNRMVRHVEAGADGVASLVPTSRGLGGEDPRGLALGLIGWQAGEPFLEEPFAERQCSIQSGDERVGAMQG